MNVRKFVFVMLLALTTAIALAAAAGQSAAQDCGGDAGCPEPDQEREKKPTVTDIPPTPTDTPTPVPPPAACVPPDEDQLAILCAGLVPPAPGGPEGANPGPDGPSNPGAEFANPVLRNPGPPDMLPLILGGGGLFLAGILIGLLLPAVMPGFSLGRFLGGGAHPPDPGLDAFDRQQKVSPFNKGGDGVQDMFAKDTDEAAQKVFPKLGDIAGQKVMPPDSFGAPADTAGTPGMRSPGPPNEADADDIGFIK